MFINTHKRRLSVYLSLILVSLFAFGAGFLGMKGIMAGPDIDLYFVPANSIVDPDGVLSLMIDSGAEEIGFVDVTFYFDNSKIQLTDEVTLTSSLGTVVSKTTMENANSSGTVNFVIGLSPGAVAPSGVFELVQFPVTSISTVDNDVAVVYVGTDNDDVQIVNVDPSPRELVDDLYESAILTLNPVVATLTPTLANTPTPTVTPTLAPSPTPILANGANLSIEGNSEAYVGENTNLDIRFSTSEGVVGVDAILLFDQTKINILDVNENNLLSSTSFIDIDNDLGIVKISQVAPVGIPFTGDGVLASLVIDPISIGEAIISFDYILNATDDSNAVSEDGLDILSAPNNFTLNINNHAFLRIKLSTDSIQGDSVEGLASIEQNAWSSIFTTSIAGITDLMQISDSLLNQVVDLIVAVPGYLNERENLTVVGEIDIDLGKLRAGDINDDGIVNNLDLAIMYDSWGDGGVIADYNKDNVVNTFDYYILTKNFYAEDE